jgi:GNAT superfamily N-acetyltransferase
MKSRIRLAIEADAPAAKACVAAAFEQYISRIGKPPGPMMVDHGAEIAASHVWLAVSDGDVVGVLVQYPTDLGFYVDTVAVAPRCQGTGVGKALLQFAEQEALRGGFDSIYLCTNAAMTENQVLYPRIGYVEYDRRHDAGYDRVFYRKQLTGDERGDARLE